MEMVSRKEPDPRLPLNVRRHWSNIYKVERKEHESRIL